MIFILGYILGILFVFFVLDLKIKLIWLVYHDGGHTVSDSLSDAIWERKEIKKDPLESKKHIWIYPKLTIKEEI